MDIEEFRNYCLSKAATEEAFPFNEDVIVFKVAGKIFATTDLAKEGFDVNLKCDPVKATELRDQYPDHIRGGFHMNKKHWNTVDFEAFTDGAFLREMIDHSYQQVVEKLPKKVQQQLNEEEP